MTSVSCPVAAGGKRVGRGRDGRRNGGREPAKTGKTCQKLTNFRGEIEKNSGKITKSHGAVGYDRNQRQNEENGWKSIMRESLLDTKCHELTARKGEPSVKCSQVSVKRDGDRPCLTETTFQTEIN